jgi:hypothetical protein
MRLREREPEKELSGQFKFTSSNSIERVYDALSNRNFAGKSPKMLIDEGLKTQALIEKRRKETAKLRLEGSKLSKESEKSNEN